jgi:Fe2+ transport system protein FeoA
MKSKPKILLMMGKCVGSNSQVSEHVIPLSGAPVQIGIGNNVIFMGKKELCDVDIFS